MGQIKSLLDQTEGHLATAMARGFTTQKKSFTNWAKLSWKGKVGLLHRHVKEQQCPKFELLTSKSHGKYEGTADPDIIIKVQQAEW